MTIRQWLAGVGGADRIRTDTEEYLDVPISCVTLASTPRTGHLQTVCGGDVILTFVPVSSTRRVLVLVRDDDDGIVWDIKRRSGREIHEIGSRPNATLRVRQTA